MAINPGYALQFKRTLDRASEPKRARATGTVTAVSSDSDGKIRSATVSTGSGLLSVPVPYGTNVYTGMTVAITNDGTPSNAQWRLSGTTSVPGGIQGGSIINHDGNTFAMFDSIWVRNDGVIIVGGDIDSDGDPTGPRVESNQCGYFGYDQYDRQSLAIYAANCGGYYAGDVFLGPEEMSRISVLPTEGVIRVVNEGRTSLEFSPDGNFIRDPLTIGNPVGARINIGEIEDKATLVVRGKNGVAKLVARTGDNDDVYLHVGNPPPEDNSMWFDSADGRLNVNGHVTMQSMDVRGRATFASTGEFMIIDPDDPGRFGVITPKGQYAYTTDALGVVHLIRVDAWGPLTLESEYGSGIWRTWVGGTQIFGDPRYRHFRIERGASARAGFFNGEVPAIYLDATGKAVFGNPDEDAITIDTENGIKFLNLNTEELLSDEGRMITFWASPSDSRPTHRISAYLSDEAIDSHRLVIQAQPLPGFRGSVYLGATSDKEAKTRIRAIGGYGTVNQQQSYIDLWAYREEGTGAFTHPRIDLSGVVYPMPWTSASVPGGTIQNGCLINTNGTYDPGGGAGVYIHYGGYFVPVALNGDATGWEAISTTATAGNVSYYTCSDAGGSYTITLPAATSKPRNWTYTFKKSNSSGNTITIDADGSATIDGATTYVLSTQYQFVTIRRAGSNWDIVAKG